jgi:hypothetical protein
MRPLPKNSVLAADDFNVNVLRMVLDSAVIVSVAVNGSCFRYECRCIFSFRHDGTLLPDCLEGGSVFKHLPLSLFILISCFRSTHNLSRYQPRSYSITCCSSCDTNSATSQAVTPGLASR